MKAGEANSGAGPDPATSASNSGAVMPEGAGRGSLLRLLRQGWAPSRDDPVHHSLAHGRGLTRPARCGMDDDPKAESHTRGEPGREDLDLACRCCRLHGQPHWAPAPVFRDMPGYPAPAGQQPGRLPRSLHPAKAVTVVNTVPRDAPDRGPAGGGSVPAPRSNRMEARPLGKLDVPGVLEQPVLHIAENAIS